MRGPTVRLSINPAELAAIRPGLDFLVNGLAMAKLGNIPDRYAGADFMIGHSGKYPDRAYSPELAAMLIGVRAKFCQLGTSRKVRLDTFELAVVGLSLRLRAVSAASPAIDLCARKIPQKIENYRRRARRAFVSGSGRSVYEEHASRWTHFAEWLRFNLALLPKATKRQAWQKRFWLDQRNSLADLIAHTLKTQCYALSGEPDMAQIVRLLKEEFRRGRHPMTLKELLADQTRASGELIFKILEKKAQLTPLPGAKLPYWRLAVVRAERFSNRGQRGTTSTAVTGPATPEAANKTDEVISTQTVPVHPSTGPHHQGLIPDLLNPALTISNFLELYVPAALWPVLRKECVYQVAHVAPLPVRVATSIRTLPALIEAVKPDVDPEDEHFVLRDLVFFSKWLMGWVRIVCPEPNKTHQAVCAGFELAFKQARAANPISVAC